MVVVVGVMVMVMEAVVVAVIGVGAVAGIEVEIVEVVVVIVVVVKFRGLRPRVDRSRSWWPKEESTIGLVVDHLQKQWPWEVEARRRQGGCGVWKMEC